MLTFTARSSASRSVKLGARLVVKLLAMRVLLRFCRRNKELFVKIKLLVFEIMVEFYPERALLMTAEAATF
jgi:hypothetical protein